MVARYEVFLIALAVLVAMVALEESQENSEAEYTENCWPDRQTCVNNSAKGSGLKSEMCWLR